MNEQSKPLLAEVLFVIEQFERDDVDIPEAQGVVDSVSRLLEQNDQAVIDELRDCEADLEFIRFATPNEQQRSAALTRLRQTDMAVRAAIGAHGDSAGVSALIAAHSPPPFRSQPS